MYCSGLRWPVPDGYSKVQRTPAAAVVLKQHLTLRGQQSSTRTAASFPHAKTDIAIETALSRYNLAKSTLCWDKKEDKQKKQKKQKKQRRIGHPYWNSSVVVSVSDDYYPKCAPFGR